jgi:hypothetical protein
LCSEGSDNLRDPKEGGQGNSATELAKSPGWARGLPWGAPGPRKAPRGLCFAHAKAKYSSALAAWRPYKMHFGCKKKHSRLWVSQMMMPEVLALVVPLVLIILILLVLLYRTRIKARDVEFELIRDRNR